MRFWSYNINIKYIFKIYMTIRLCFSIKINTSINRLVNSIDNANIKSYHFYKLILPITNKILLEDNPYGDYE